MVGYTSTDTFYVSDELYNKSKEGKKLTVNKRKIRISIATEKLKYSVKLKQNHFIMMHKHVKV